MKNHMTSVAVGACLLLSSAGVAFADNLHPFTITGTGQPGSNNGIACNGGSPTNPDIGPGPGGSVNAMNPSGTNGSPFNTSVPKAYAGNQGNPTFAGSPGVPAGHSNANRDHAVSQYDVACAQHFLHSGGQLP